MKLASIVPMKNVAHTFDGDYAMLLAHLKDYYPERRNKNCYVIMDNSLIELGGAVDVETVYNAAKQCGADEFILPDTLRDGVSTVAKAIDSILYLQRENLLGDFNLMAVCQGNTLDEFEWCFHELENLTAIHCIGIPKAASELLEGGRPKLEFLWQNCNKAIHLLGCATSLTELKKYKHPEKIRSCDTCIPALLSTRGIDDAWVDRPRRTIDLIADKIHPKKYEKIMDQLRAEGLL